MARIPTVELHQAFFWTCDRCGRDNFERGITVAVESIDPADLPDGMDLESLREFAGPGAGATLLRTPAFVGCVHCSARYQVDPG